VTIAKRPSCEGGTRESVELICPTAQEKYFCKGDWTTQITLNCFMKSNFWRNDFAGLKSRKSAIFPENRNDFPVVGANHLPSIQYNQLHAACCTSRVGSDPKFLTMQGHEPINREPINSEWRMSALVRIPDSGRTSREVRKVSDTDNSRRCLV
jgi:hypothetical protein